MMGRIVHAVLVYGFAGALLMYLTSFACAMWSQPRALDPGFLSKIRYEFFGDDPQPDEPVLFPTIAYKAFGAHFIVLAIDDAAVNEDPTFGPYPCATIVRAGWPFLATGGWCFYEGSLRRAPALSFALAIPVEGMTVSADRMSFTRMLPLRPLWPGALGNTAFYGIVSGMFWMGMMKVRSVIRIRRRLCPHCAYPIGVSNRCSECGGELPGKSATLLP